MQRRFAGIARSYGFKLVLADATEISLRQENNSVLVGGVAPRRLILMDSPNKNRHTFGINYFHFHTRLNYWIAWSGNGPPELAANANHSFRCQMTLGDTFISDEGL